MKNLPLTVADAALASAFLGYVDAGPAKECWLWRGPRRSHRHGLWYGRFNYLGRSYRAHRVALALHIGRDLGPGLIACHTCDNPSCVNPGHLYEGTVADNNRDAVERGRKTHPLLTHCRRGHLFEGENIMVRHYKNGHIDRTCRECDRQRQIARRERNIFLYGKTKRPTVAESYVPARTPKLPPNPPPTPNTEGA